ncbi:unnamed protein product [Toxocara canis]|uniref:Protein kinase domain-containing protein n=1 Tax=Toxocara canis TaxID=6265 RepID=A0A183UNG5_TOXCA|nr:unnamed protein product [Toxocara canis]
MVSKIGSPFHLCCISSLDGEDDHETFKTLKKHFSVFQVECLIHVLAAASNRKHIFRLLQRGANTALHIRYFITDAYGPTLSDLQARRPFQKFTVGTATRLAIETLNAIEDLHTVGYVHGDITPTSFVIGRDELENHIYITNFAKVRKFRTKYAKIIPRRSYVPFTSSVRYASRACHDRLECARKDDLESWLFMSVEFYQIRILSWRLLTNLTEIRRRKDIFMSERGIPRVSCSLIADCCLKIIHVDINRQNACCVTGANSIKIECVSLPERLPSVVAEILSLRYESMPNYEAIKESFKKHLDTRNYKVSVWFIIM